MNLAQSFFVAYVPASRKASLDASYSTNFVHLQQQCHYDPVFVLEGVNQLTWKAKCPDFSSQVWRAIT